MNQDNGEDVNLNTPEADVDLDTTQEESVEDYKARLAKAEELANNYKIRAEKAEKKAKEPHDEKPQPMPTAKESDLSTMDIIALSKSNIDTEDMNEVVRWAKYNNISVSEALKSQELNAVLGVRKEMRTTALATNTGGAKRSSGKVSDETLIAQASKGNVPDSDDDITRLVRAKMLNRRN